MLKLALLQTGVVLAMSLWLSIGPPVTWWDFAVRAVGGWLLLLGVGLAGLWLALRRRRTFSVSVRNPVAALAQACRDVRGPNPPQFPKDNQF